MKKLFYLVALFIGLSFFTKAQPSIQKQVWPVVNWKSPQANNENIDPGFEYLTTQSLFFYDFTTLTGTSGSNILAGNAGLQDYGPNNYDLTPINLPQVIDLTFNGQTTKTFEDALTRCVSTGINGSQLFAREKFRIFIMGRLTDGQPGAAVNLLGGIIPTNIGLNVFYSPAGANAGKLNITMGNSGGVFNWRSTNNFFSNAVNGIFLAEIEVNFSNDSIKFYDQGYRYNSEQSSGSMAGYNFSDWDNTQPIYIGSLNNNGTATSNADTNLILACALVENPNSTQLLNIRKYFYAKLHPEYEITIDDITELNTKRTSLVASVFNGSGIPALSPTITTSYTGAMHIYNSANITGWNTISRHSYTTTDIDGFSWTNLVYRIETSTPILYSGKRRIIIVTQGHNSETPGEGEDLMSDLLAAGYDVAICALPVCGQNTETNPSITQTSTQGHDQIFSTGLDRVGYNALTLYFFDKTSFINNLLSTYNAFGYTGLSGGGWCTVLMTAMMPDVWRGISVRGNQPRTNRDNTIAFAEGDYEQGGSLFTDARCGPRIKQLYTDHTYMDLYIMATSGGRPFKLLVHLQDACCFRGDSFYSWDELVAQQVLNVTGSEFSVRLDQTTANFPHAYSPLDIADILDFFLN